jgi:uncharacterized OB-fold protein
MAYLPDDVPTPEPTIDDKPFWDACAKRELRYQRCTACRKFRHPPAPGCPNCKSFDLEWVIALDDAELYSFTIVNYSAHPAVQKVLPYNVAIVLFPSYDNVRLVSNVIDAKPEELMIGMRLWLVWEELTSGVFLPRFMMNSAEAKEKVGQ